MALNQTEKRPTLGRSYVIATRHGLAELDLAAVKISDWNEGDLSTTRWSMGLRFAGWVIIYRLTI